MNILLDVDGVLADFWSGYRKIIKGQTGKELPLQQESWDYGDFGVTLEEDNAFWRFVDSRDNFWYTLPALATRAEFTRINAISLHDNVYFVTKRFGPYAKQQTELWLDAHGIIYPTVLLIDRNKGGIAKHLGINFALDDKPSNVWDMSHHCWSYILDAPHNRNWKGLWEKDLRVKAVEEFLDIISTPVVPVAS